MSSRVTIEDVANLARVSKVTVSYVLNDRSVAARISSDTADRVRRAAEELGYRKNAVARMLKTRRSYILAVLFQYADLFSAGSDFTSEVMRGVCAAATERGYDLMLHTRSAASPDEEVAGLVDGRVDGILVLRDGDDPALQILLKQSIPCVSFFCPMGAAYVDSQNEEGGRIAVRHLAELGHRQILILRGAVGSVSSNDRIRGARLEAELFGLSTPMVMDSGDAPGWKALLDQPDRPTAVFGWSDDSAVLVIDYLREKGIRCPEQVSVIGFDSLSKATRSSPPLTSVAQPVSEMAHAAVYLLTDLIDGSPEGPLQIRYPVRLDVRGSTGPPPS
jgi:LacI family transcriptional regulator